MKAGDQMVRRIVLWPSSDNWPTWWLFFLTLRLSWFGARLTSDALPFVGEMLVAAVIVLALWPVAMAITRWLRARLDDGGGGGRAPRRREGSLGEG